MIECEATFAPSPSTVNNRKKATIVDEFTSKKIERSTCEKYNDNELLINRKFVERESVHVGIGIGTSVFS